MKKHRKLIFLLFTGFFCLTVVCAASLNGHAETMPDLSHLDDSYLLSDNRQVIAIPGEDYAVVSTDSSQLTYIAFIDKNGSLLDDSQAVVLFFPYQKAAVCGNNLYVAGRTVSNQNTLEIDRIGLSDKTRIKNQILKVECDFTRGFYAQQGGALYLVTEPAGATPSASSSFSLYHFSDEPNAILSGSRAPGFSPSSALPASSAVSSGNSQNTETSSSQPSAPSEQSSSSPSSSSSSAAEYRFSSPVTVTDLQKQLDADGRGAVIRVTAPNGNAVSAGSVGTGSLVEVMLNGKVDSRVTAVIPGDLTGTGIITQQDTTLLWEYFIGQRSLSGLYLEAADMNQDGRVDTSDMLKLKAIIS